MADIRQNAEVLGKLTVEGGGASTTLEVNGSSDSGVSSYTQFKLTDQNTGTLLELFNQAGTSEFKVSTTGTQIGGVYTLPHTAPSENQILTRATGASAGVLSWQNNVADADSIGGYPVDLTANGGLDASDVLFYSTANGGEWQPGAIVVPTPNFNSVLTAGSTTALIPSMGGAIFRNSGITSSVSTAITINTTDTVEDNDLMPSIIWQANNDAPSSTIFARADVKITDPSDGTEDSVFRIKSWRDGTDELGLEVHGKEITIAEEYIMPTADGDAGQVIKTDGAGNLSFATVSGGADELNDLSDVNLTTAAAINNDVLVYDTDTFVPKQLSLQTVTDVGGTTSNMIYTTHTSGVISVGGFTAIASNIQTTGTGTITSGASVTGNANGTLSTPGIVGLSAVSEPAIRSRTSIASPNVNAAVGLELFKSSLGDGSNVFLPSVSWQSMNSGSAKFEAANIYTYLTDDTSGSEDAMLCIKTVEAGTVKIAAEFNGGAKIYNHAEDGAPNNDIVIYNPTTSPADDDVTGQFTMRGKNNASQDVDYVSFLGGAQDVTDGAEDGAAIFQVMKAGTLTEVLEFSYETGINFYNGRYGIPDADGTEGQVLAWPSAGTELEWVTPSGGGNKVYFSKAGRATLATPGNRWYGDANEGSMEDIQSNHTSSIDPGTIFGQVDSYFHNGFVAPFDFTNVRVVGYLANSGDADLYTDDLTLELWRIHTLTSGTDNGSISLMGSVTQTFNSDSGAVFSIDFDCTSNMPEDGDAFFITFTSPDASAAIAFKFNLTFECT